MKKLNLMLVLPALLAMQNVFAQTAAHLKLSDQFPSAGEKLTFTYDATGTPVDGKKDITASVYFLDNKSYPVADVVLKPEGKLLKGDFTVDNTAKAFFVKISSGEAIDDNNTQGYVYLVYKDKQPVPGAYAAKGYLVWSGMGAYFTKLKTDAVEGMALYKKEFATYPQSEKEFQNAYYLLMAANKAYRADVDAKIALLEKSDYEKDLIFATSLLTATKRKAQADSLRLIAKAKFPKGDLVKGELATAFTMQKNLVKKDSLFQAYLQLNPEIATEKNTAQNSLRLQLAGAYLTAGDMANFSKYESQLKDKSNLASVYNSVAWNWVLKGEHLAEAEKISKQSLDLLTAKIANPVAGMYSSPKQAKEQAQVTYYMYADTYAMILLKTGKPAEALKYEQAVYEYQKSPDAAISEDYVTILVANGMYTKAQEIAEMSLKTGKSTEGLKTEFKKTYVKLKGSDAGYDQYLASLEGAAKDKAHEDLLKTMIKETAPLFSLKDLNGNAVTLADLKGKVVIVDFWATWCGPCKASFPGMQMAVNKYKDDPNVMFLFVDCWENETPDKYVPGVKKFIADNKYTFNVLIDEKGNDDRQSKVVGSYGVTGIPTKFVIDKSGNIRFKYVGYAGTPQALVEEVSTMIEVASNPEVAKSGTKVSMNK